MKRQIDSYPPTTLLFRSLVWSKSFEGLNLKKSHTCKGFTCNLLCKLMDVVSCLKFVPNIDRKYIISIIQKGSLVYGFCPIPDGTGTLYNWGHLTQSITPPPWATEYKLDRKSDWIFTHLDLSQVVKVDFSMGHSGRTLSNSPIEIKSGPMSSETSSYVTNVQIPDLKRHLRLWRFKRNLVLHQMMHREINLLVHWKFRHGTFNRLTQVGIWINPFDSLSKPCPLSPNLHTTSVYRISH